MPHSVARGGREYRDTKRSKREWQSNTRISGSSRTGWSSPSKIRRPPHNFFDNALINEIADAFEAADADTGVRSIVLAAQGKSFCAGADFSKRDLSATTSGGANSKHLYKEATRLFRAKKPIVAAIHGAAIGGGLGLALVADFRVTSTEARFSANFTRLGFHPGFALTYTLPRLVGQQQGEPAFLHRTPYRR